MNFDSLAVHSGHTRQGNAQPATPTIDRAASWAFDSMVDLERAFSGEAPAYFYGRDGMPTPAHLEEALTVLEGGADTVVFATGMAAINAVLTVTGTHRRILAAPDLYGRTYHLLQSWLPAAGAEIRFIAAQERDAVAEALASWRPHLLVVETLSNPLVKVSDLPWLIEHAHAVDCRVLVDNTFASPYLCRPAELGADFTVESLTKYINGHGDVLGGAVTVVDVETPAQLRNHRAAFGAVMDPQAAWLTLRGLRTLGLRLRQHGANALALASFLAGHTETARVYYPGLSSDPGHALATRLFGGRGYGGMLAFDLRQATQERAWAVMDRLQLALRAPTLGDIATLVAHPARSSHRGLSPAQRAAIGIGDGLIRVSVGIEDADDILADFRQALTSESEIRRFRRLPRSFLYG